MDFVELSDEEVEYLFKIEVPDKRTVGGWEVDFDALVLAYKFCKLKYPLKVKLHAKGKYRRGTHYARGDLTGHVIILNQKIPKEQAQSTIWHELAHAMQAEAFERITGSPMQNFYRESYRHAHGEWGASYENNRYEIHAREFAERRPFEVIK